MNILNVLTSRWARLGVSFNVEPSIAPIDVEDLLIDTARHAREHSRLLIAAVSWLAAYGAYVDIDRLIRLIHRDLSLEDQSVMGLILNLAHDEQHSELAHFIPAMDACAPRTSGRPLSNIENASARLIQLARDRASDISKKWGEWYESFPAKTNALRPRTWVLSHNPNLRHHESLKTSA